MGRLLDVLSLVYIVLLLFLGVQQLIEVFNQLVLNRLLLLLLDLLVDVEDALHCVSVFVLSYFFFGVEASHQVEFVNRNDVFYTLEVAQKVEEGLGSDD